MAPNVPPSLKKIKVFLSRAEELDRDKSNPESRVVAYNCRQYAVLAGIPLAGADAAAKSCLGELLGSLEKEKAAMAVFSREEHWKICKKVADRVFERADGEDREGGGNKGTARTFYAAGTFYEILQQFHDEKTKEGGVGDGDGDGVDDNGEEDEARARIKEEDSRRLYCKWKATEILNAIKEGRTPAPGGYKQDEMADAASALVGTEDSEPSLPSIGEGAHHAMPSINEELPPAPVLPPAPSMPSSDMFNDFGPSGDNNEQSNMETNNNNNNNNDAVPDEMMPPQYNAVELSLTGEPTPTVEDVNEDSDDEDIGNGGDIFIPGAAANAAASVNEDNNIFENAISPVAPPPPPYQAAARTYESNANTTPAIPPPVAIPPPAAPQPLPPPPAPAAPTHTSINNSSGMFGGLFGKSSGSTKLSKAQMADAVELTKFALAALQKGDGDLGRERLEQALGIWRSAHKRPSVFGKSSPSKKHSTTALSSRAAEYATAALEALKKGDGTLGRQRLEQALGV